LSGMIRTGYVWFLSDVFDFNNQIAMCGFSIQVPCLVSSS